METDIQTVTESNAVYPEINAILNMRWGPRTQYGYQRCIVEFFTWLENSPQSVEYRHMLTSERQLAEGFHISSFLAFCAQKKKIDKSTGEAINLSYSGINKYRSALKYYYTKNQRSFTPHEEEQLSDFFKGIKINKRASLTFRVPLRNLLQQ